jgi:hypothetical protein
LTKNVPIGKADGKLFCKYLDARNLEILPRNPPVPMNSNDLIMSSLFSCQKLLADVHNINSKVLIQFIVINVEPINFMVVFITLLFRIKSCK